VQDLLVTARPEEVRQAIRDLRSELGRHGKYILSCSHLIQIDTPIANIDAIVEEIRA
jgi:uroporphyrinogen-III decarboxylase